MSGIIYARRAGRPVRSGFTLIELLVVIGIIAVLLTITGAAAFRFLGSQKSSVTRTLITRLNSRLMQQTAYAADLARNKIPVTSLATSMANGDKDRAKVIHTKFVFGQWFPTTFAEAVNGPGQYLNPTLDPNQPPNPYPPIPGYVSYLAQFGITWQKYPPGTPVAAHESAACLYMILRHGPETTGDDDMGLASGTRNINNIPVLVDGWSNPLMYCRWPTGDLTPGGKNTGVSPVNPSGAQTGFNDPLDPKGLLTAATWWSLPVRKQFTSHVHPLPPRNAAGAGVSLNLAPVIVSAGPDGKMGFAQGPTTQASTLQIQVQGDVNDNLYSTYVP